MFHLDFSSVQTHVGYHFLMTLALIVPFLIAWRRGQRQGFPTATWLTTLGLIFGLMLIGSRLGAFHADEWAALFYQGEWYSEAPKTAIGGIVLGLLAYQILKRWFHLPPAAADAIVLSVPVGVIIGRMGCLVAGCCYGTPAGGPWAITYGPESSAFQDQVACGTIASDALNSLPVHPVQLDLLLYNLVIFAILWAFRNKLKPGYLTYLGIALVALGRFGSEFFRDLATNRGATGIEWGGLKAAQWLTLTIGIGSHLLWWLDTKQERVQTVFREQPLLTLSAILFPLSLLLWVFRLRLGILETLVFIGTLSPAVVAVMIALWKKEQSALVRWPSAALLSGTLAIQLLAPIDSLRPDTLLPDTLLPVGAVKVVPPAPKSWWDVGTGYAYSRFQDYDATTTGSGCNSQTTVYNDRKIVTQSGGLEVSHHHLNGENHFASGGRIQFGNALTKEGYPDLSGRYMTMGMFTHFGGRWVGGSAGLSFLPDQTREVLTNAKRTSPFFLTGGLRVGLRPRYSFDIQFRERQQFLYYRYPDFTIGVINWGFNDPTGQTWMRFGLASITSRGDLSYFGALRVPIFQRRMALEYGFYQGVEARFSHSVGVHYLIPYK